MTQIELIRATPADVLLLQAVSRQTFYETFAAANSAEDMDVYLAQSLATDKLAAELAVAESEFYLAVDNTQAIAYLKLNFGEAQTEPADQQAMEIERIYVLKSFQGKNIGQLLFEKAMQRARQQQATYVWLGVWEENHGAIGFYQRNGFVAFGKHVFRLGNDEQTDIMMKLALPAQ